MNQDYKVKDINLADFGMKEISIAETEYTPYYDMLKIYN